MVTRQRKKGGKRKAAAKPKRRAKPRAPAAPIVTPPAPPKDPADAIRPAPSAAWAQSRKLCRFIVSLGHHGNVTWALRAAKLDRGYAYERRGSDQEFGLAWDDARKQGLEVLKDEAWRRAHEGVLEPKFHAGKVVGHVRHYSDSLLMFLIKQSDPTYREHFDLSLANQGGRPFMFQMLLHPDAVAPPKP